MISEKADEDPSSMELPILVGVIDKRQGDKWRRQFQGEASTKKETQWGNRESEAGEETLRRDLKVNKEWPREVLGEGGPASTKALRWAQCWCLQETKRPVWQVNATRPDIREHFGCTQRAKFSTASENEGKTKITPVMAAEFTVCQALCKELGMRYFIWPTSPAR